MFIIKCAARIPASGVLLKETHCVLVSCTVEQCDIVQRCQSSKSWQKSIDWTQDKIEQLLLELGQSGTVLEDHDDGQPDDDL
ncbi:hypothetical protein PGT21_019514 [Puccinia graminis f. sp. tritici]|uniref:Uncharacterized protein n=1 Tax=Puccinia graminis f. sp. tritici TaxID=56615 RepID=A0A5B0MLT7_PUCGR|nr:hypothetical protein PGT21_019514 [Puccinia graminis f. sp. tritici]KAA1126964.1 hypothetical protein PGTUg99_034089 [Puccinia graminis f. sp. tritici]